MSGANPANFSAGQQIANPIYIVDSSGNQITSFGGGTQYTTGAATPGSPIGTMPVFDSGGTIAKVSLAVGLPVNIVGGGGSGGTALADDAAFTAGSTSFTPSGGVYNDAVAAATSGHADTVRLSQNRAFHINIRSNAGTELATASNPLQVSLANTAANGTAVTVSATNLQTNVNQIAGSNITAAASGTQLVGVADGTGNALTSNSTTYTAKKALDANILGTLGTAFSTAGKVDVKASSGDFATGAITDLPAKGQAAMAASVPVTMANNQTALPVGVSAGTAFDGNSGTISANSLRTVAGGAATGTKSNVASSASSVTILASNTSRKGATVYNDSTQILYLDCSGGTASATSYTLQIPANGFFELPGPNIYNGAITGIWAAANGNARITEWT